MRRQKVRVEIITLIIFFWHLPVSAEVHKGVAVVAHVTPDVAKEGAGGFKPLKTLLERLPSVYANHKVRPRLYLKSLSY